MPTCPTDNAQAVDQEGFWISDGIHWDAHRIGWAVSGGCAVITVIITIFSVLSHCRNYTVPAEQRQIIRILYMPPVYAIISFFSYRFFRDYTYYELIEIVYEAVTLSAFMLLIIEYVAATATGHSASKALERKDKQKLPFPLCCWRFRPTKAYFLYTMKWLVLQYVVVRPLVSVAGIICQAYKVLCVSEGLTHFEFAYVYLSIVDFISISVSLYGLFIFYELTKEELKGQRPLAKFMCIKLIVMFTFYQTFVFELLEGRVIHATAYWTETNIANGLNALAICIEMVFFALAMIWSYPATPYKKSGVHTSIGRPLVDSINFSDFAVEIWGSLKFFVAYMRGKPGARTPKRNNKPNLVQAFGAEGALPTSYPSQLYLQPQLAASTAHGYSPTTSSDTNPTYTEEGNKAGVGSGLGKASRSYHHSEAQTSVDANPDLRSGSHKGNKDREENIDQYSENVHLTTFPPRNGTTAGAFDRDSEDVSAEGGTYSYPQQSGHYPPPSQSGHRRY